MFAGWQKANLNEVDSLNPNFKLLNNRVCSKVEYREGNNGWYVAARNFSVLLLNNSRQDKAGVTWQDLTTFFSSSVKYMKVSIFRGKEYRLRVFIILPLGRHVQRLQQILRHRESVRTLQVLWPILSIVSQGCRRVTSYFVMCNQPKSPLWSVYN